MRLRRITPIASVRMRISSPSLDATIYVGDVSWHGSLGGMYHVDAELIVKDASCLEADLIGKRFIIEYGQDADTLRLSGICIRAAARGYRNLYPRFDVAVFPWLWHLTQNHDSRVYQNMTCVEIAVEIFRRYNFSLFEVQVGELEKMVYRVQIDEDDYSFVCRTLEEHGVYFYFRQDAQGEIMVMTDNVGGHPLPPTNNPAKLRPTYGAASARDQFIDHFASERHVVPTEVTDSHANFTRSKQVALARRQSSDLPGFSERMSVFQHRPSEGSVDDGEARARRRIEAVETRHHRFRGGGNLRSLTVGSRFKLQSDDNAELEGTYLIVSGSYLLTANDDSGYFHEFPDQSLAVEEFRCRFEAIPASRPYRPQRITPGPQVNSIMTAVVTGPPGEEIHTDEFGRVKIQFHWDRYGPKDQTSSCWVRVATPWAGKSWGSLVIPRIGQEVIVQFEDGDPDRPIVTGMLYNAENKPPYTLPAGATQSGFKSNTSKGGGGANEIRMEDRKDAQELSLTAEKDYALTVKNDATISVGFEKASPGSMVQKVKQDLTSEVESGDHTFTVKTGKSTVTIASGREETIEAGGDKLDVTGERTVNASVEYKVTTPKATIHAADTAEIELQDVTVNGTVKTTIGENEIEITGTTVKITGMQSIELVCGASSIKLDASGVTVMGPMIKLN